MCLGDRTAHRTRRYVMDESAVDYGSDDAHASATIVDTSYVQPPPDGEAPDEEDEKSGASAAPAATGGDMATSASSVDAIDASGTAAEPASDARDGAGGGSDDDDDDDDDKGDERRDRQRSRFAGEERRRSRSRSRSRSAERRRSRERYQHQRRDDDYRGGGPRSFDRQRQPVSRQPYRASGRPADREISLDGRRPAGREPPMRREPVAHSSRSWDDRPRDDGRRAAHAASARPENHPARRNRPPASDTRPSGRHSKPSHPLDPRQGSSVESGATEQRHGAADAAARWERGVQPGSEQAANDSMREARRRAFASFEF